MKRTVLFCSLAAWLCPASVFAQDQKPNTISVNLTEAVERIVSEEPTRLLHLRGELLANNPEAVDYESILKLEGADNCVISVFNTPGDTTACWKADLPAVDDFGAAQKVYHSLYESLKAARISNLHPGVTYRLEGGYTAASADKSSNSIEFVLSPAEPEFKKIRVQVLMNYVMPEWNIQVQIYEKPGELGETASDQ